MKKLVAGLLVLVFAMTVLAMPAFAAASKAEKGVADAGNKMCPVSGDPVSGKNFVDYKGVRYGLCCPMCEGPFLKDPEKYLAAMKAGKPATGMAGMQREVKEKASVAAVTVPATAADVSASKEMEKSMEQGSL